MLLTGDEEDREDVDLERQKNFLIMSASLEDIRQNCFSTSSDALTLNASLLHAS